MLTRPLPWLAPLAVVVGCGGTSAAPTSHPPDAAVDSPAPPRDGGRVGDGGPAQMDAGHPVEDAGRDASPVRPLDAGGAVDSAFVPFDAGPCGSRTGMRGLTSRKMTVAGLARTYLIYIPTSYDPVTPMPMVLVFHGYTMSGQAMLDITQYTAIADAEGIALAFPDGEGGPNSLTDPWDIENPGQKVCGDGQLVSATGNDFAFIDAMKEDVSQDQCLDTPHIFVTGFSMGGYFAEHVGCYRSDIRAVAPHSGGTLADLSVCTTGHVPVILFRGTADPVIDDACDNPTVTADPGFPPSATLWAAKNGCAATYHTLATNGDAGGTGQCYVYDNCPSDGQVELCTFNGMVHCWAGGSNTGAADDNACPPYASATQLQWAFFKQYAW